VLLLVADALEDETIVSCGLQEFSDCPDVICNSGLHGRGNTERLMHAAEVEIDHVKVTGSFQVFQRFAETQAKSRKAPQVCPHGQIGSLYMACGNTRRMRVSSSPRASSE
jgi:hypothetical protein